MFSSPRRHYSPEERLLPVIIKQGLTYGYAANYILPFDQVSQA
jgi:hypothetical protein